MTLLSRQIRLVLAAIGFLIFAGLVPGAAQTSSVINPNAQAVNEQQLLKDHYFISGRGTIADTKSYVIEQPLGRTWRLITGMWMHWIGALAILGVVALLALAYFTLGPLMIEDGRSGRKSCALMASSDSCTG